MLEHSRKKLLVVAAAFTVIGALLILVSRSLPQGPVKLVVREQQLYVLADGTLYRLSADGTLLDRRASRQSLLAASDFLLLANGDVLIADADAKDIFRCDSLLLSCRSIYAALGSAAGALNRSLKLAVDEKHDQLWVADTANHRLLLLDLVGGLKRVYDGQRFEYPNQIGFSSKGELVVADTNHHRIAAFDPAGELDAPRWQINVSTHAERRHGRRWPSAWAEVGEDWWVIAEDSGMVNGDVLRFGASGAPLTRAVPEAIDPLSAVRFGDEILVADAASAAVHRVALDGKVAGRFGDAAFQHAMSKISERAARHRQFRRWLPALIGLIALAAVVALKRLGEPLPGDEPIWPQWQADATQKMPAYLAPGEEVWLQADPALVQSSRRRMTLALTLLALATLVCASLLYRDWTSGAFTPRNLSLLVLLGLVTVIVVAIRKGVVHEFGYDATHVLRKNAAGQVMRYPLETVRFSNRGIAIGRGVAPLVNPQGRLVYDNEAVRKGFIARLPAQHFMGDTGFQLHLIKTGNYFGWMLAVVVMVCALWLLRTFAL